MPYSIARQPAVKGNIAIFQLQQPVFGPSIEKYFFVSESDENPKEITRAGDWNY
jgi:hypothetical protein